MFPWNYGFHWSTGTMIFMGAFYTVLVVVATTLISAAIRSSRAVKANRLAHVRWHSDFHDLPNADRDCRHVLTGELKHRECPNAFDCRGCEVHARLLARGLVPQTGGPEDEMFGMSFPLDRLYHRGHTWARLEEDGTVTVGLDELGKRLLGTPEAVTLPNPGEQLHANGTAFRLRRRNAEVAVLSPVDGKVVATGGADQDWYLKVKPAAAGEPAFRHLLRGCEVKAWLLREMERLQLALAAEGAAPTLADGGVPVSDIAACYPEADWDAVCGQMFLRP